MSSRDANAAQLLSWIDVTACNRGSRAIACFAAETIALRARRRRNDLASGSVYLAFDEFSGREVALKFYEAGKSADVSNFARSQFLTEAALAGRLWHPHIALILDACSDDSISYVVTEFVPGGSLSQFTGPSAGRAFENWAEFALDLGKAGRLSQYDKTVPDSVKFTALKSRPMLAEGEAKVTLQDRLLNVLESGEWFGEQPFISGHAVPRQATVETTVDSLLVEFPLEKLEALGERCQRRFVRALLRTLADRLALSNVRISRMG